jgi:hypothetical protein
MKWTSSRCLYMDGMGSVPQIRPYANVAETSMVEAG